MASRSTVFCTLAAAGALALLGGCYSNTAAGRDAKVRSDLTPELATLSMREIEVDNRQTLTIDENMRMAREDWNRLWLMDRPSRLARPRVPR